MEEHQRVPSAGFSPPPSSDIYDVSDNYLSKYSHHQNNSAMTTGSHQNPNSYIGGSGGNGGSQPSAGSALEIEQFDMSLLDFDDLATVPSPSWSTSASLEPTSWQQLSFYASSPSGADFRSLSPECKPALSPIHPYSGDNQIESKSSVQSRGNVNEKIGSEGFTTTSVNSLSGGNCLLNNGSKSPSPSQDNAVCDRNLLLRQCLEDMSFQRKYNFKPLEIQSSDLFLGDIHERETNAREISSSEGGTITTTSLLSASTTVGGSLELNQIYNVFSQAFKDIRSDIERTCSLLCLSPEPMEWSGSDVQAWLIHTLSSLSGGKSLSMTTLRHYWNLDGRTLCSFKEEDFKKRDPIHGETVFAQLDLWKMLQGGKGGKSYQEQESHSNSNAQSGQQQNNSNNNSGAVLSSLQEQQELQQHLADQDLFDLETFLESSLLSPFQSQRDVKPQISSFGLTTNSVDEITEKSLLSPENLLNMSVGSVEGIQSPPSSSFSSPIAPDLPMITDDEEEEEDDDEMKGTKSRDISPPTSVPPTTTVVKQAKIGTPSGKSGSHIHLWQFLKELLESPQQYGSCIRWLDQSRGVFKIEDSVRVARLWGLRKNRPAMNYDKLSRSIRQYYRKGIMRKTERSQRLVYQFCHPYGL